MHTPPAPSVVLFVADVPRVSAFYRALASMALLHEDEMHVVLGIDGLELVIHQLRGEPTVQPDANGRPTLREDSYWKLCLPVQSLPAARETGAAHGGGIRTPEHGREGPGFRACDGHDPEGNVMQVRVAVA